MKRFANEAVAEIALQKIDCIVEEVLSAVDVEDGPSYSTASSMACVIGHYLGTEWPETEFDAEELIRLHLGGVSDAVLV